MSVKFLSSQNRPEQPQHVFILRPGLPAIFPTSVMNFGGNAIDGILSTPSYCPFTMKNAKISTQIYLLNASFAHGQFYVGYTQDSDRENKLIYNTYRRAKSVVYKSVL